MEVVNKKGTDYFEFFKLIVKILTDSMQYIQVRINGIYKEKIL